MSRIWSIMDIGKRSLMNNQTGLQTVSHNIANRGTEGYSRQRVELKSNVPISIGRNRIGMGATTGGIVRTNNSFLEKQIERSGSELSRRDARMQSLAQVEEIYNEQVNKGLNQYLSEFFNSMRELSNSPESLSARTLVKEQANFLAGDFNRLHNDLTRVQGEIDFQIVSHVNEINEITKEIADLNKTIANTELGDAVANDERDRRDILVKKLSEKVDINYSENDKGILNVTAGRSAILVSDFESRELLTSGTVESDRKREGQVEVFFKPFSSSSPQNVTKQIKGGALGGLLDVRDRTVNNYLDEVNELATTMTRETNRIHRQGYDQKGQKGQNFFVLSSLKDAALNIKLNSVVKDDVSRIAVAGAPFSPGDNRIANQIGELQYKKVLNGGTTSVDDYYASMVGRVGIESERAASAKESQLDSNKQLRKVRESISGVSLDEETANMIKLQKSFDASARLIRAADEMMDTVLNIKRM